MKTVSQLDAEIREKIAQAKQKTQAEAEAAIQRMDDRAAGKPSSASPRAEGKETK